MQSGDCSNGGSGGMSMPAAAAPASSGTDEIQPSHQLPGSDLNVSSTTTQVWLAFMQNTPCIGVRLQWCWFF